VRYPNVPVYLRLRHVLYALIVAVIVYIIREVRRYRLRVRPSEPNLTMDEAWQYWLDGLDKHPDQELFPRETSARSLPERVLTAARESLLRVEAASLESGRERRLIREAIIAAVTMEFQLEAIARHSEEERAVLIKGYEEGMDPLLRDAIAGSRVQWIVLREYARRRFDDAVPGDWFHHYVYLARPYITEKMRLAREYVLRTDAGASRFVEIYDTLLAELRARVLKARPKRRFVRPDLPWE